MFSKAALQNEDLWPQRGTEENLHKAGRTLRRNRIASVCVCVLVAENVNGLHFYQYFIIALKAFLIKTND